MTITTLHESGLEYLRGQYLAAAGRAFTSSAARSMAAAWDLVGPCRRATASSLH
jgi:hypothetical protein